MMVVPALALAAVLAAQGADPPPAIPPGTLKVRAVDAGTTAPLPGVWISLMCFGAGDGFWQYQRATDANGEISSVVGSV